MRAGCGLLVNILLGFLLVELLIGEAQGNASTSNNKVTQKLSSRSAQERHHLAGIQEKPHYLNISHGVHKHAHQYVYHIFKRDSMIDRHEGLKRMRRTITFEKKKTHSARHGKLNSRTAKHEGNYTRWQKSRKHFPKAKRQGISRINAEGSVREKNKDGNISGVQISDKGHAEEHEDSHEIAKRNHMHISPVLLNAIQLVLDERNYFKKDANALQLAGALQNKEATSTAIARSILTSVRQGMTGNGHRARMVHVKDSGSDSDEISPGYRRRVAGSRRVDPLSHLVNPTELGISILKLLFGRRAYLVADPKYSADLQLHRGKLDPRLLAGYGSPRQRTELQNRIEKENEMILLRGVRKKEFTNSLARSISDLIKAMNKGEMNRDFTLKESTAKHLRKPGKHVQESGTRKSWVLLKIPKGEGPTDSSKVYSSHTGIMRDDEPRPKHPQITTMGKHNNALANVKVTAIHKPAKQGTIEAVGQIPESKIVAKEPKGDFMPAGVEDAKKETGGGSSEETESRAVPQVISSTKQTFKLHDEPKTSGSVPPGTMAFSLTKILQAIESTIKDLRDQPGASKPANAPEAPLKSSPLSPVTVPDRGPPKSQLATPASSPAVATPEVLPKPEVATSKPNVMVSNPDVSTSNAQVTASKQDTSNQPSEVMKPDVASQSRDPSTSAIPDLLAAIKKLVSSKEIPQIPAPSSQSGFAKIPSDDSQTQFSPSTTQVDTGARRFSGMLSRSQERPLVMRPEGSRSYSGMLGSSPENPLEIRPEGPVEDEAITRTSQPMQAGDNVLFESDDEMGTPRDRQATIDAIKLKEDLESFAEKGLQAHNRHRAKHHAVPLTWSDNLATQAEKMAYDMAMKGAIERSEIASQLGYGENVAKMSGTTFNKAGEEATDLWYDEGKNYSFSDPRLSARTDAFTQVIWKGTKKIGMGCARDLQTNDLYVVALYDPKGNDVVGLRSNVIRDGGVVGDVYASIFKRYKLHPKSKVPTVGMLKKLHEKNARKN